MLITNYVEMYDVGGSIDRIMKRDGEVRQSLIESSDDPDYANLRRFQLKMSQDKYAESKITIERHVDISSKEFELQVLDRVVKGKERSRTKLAKQMHVSFEQMMDYLAKHPFIDSLIINNGQQFNKVVAERNGEQVVFASIKRAAEETGMDRSRLINYLKRRHNPQLINGWVMKRKLWYVLDGGFG